MNKITDCIFLVLFLAGSASACDCTTYPFKPNPPCYSECVETLTSNKNINLSSVKNIDPGVSVSISVLRQQADMSTINASAINDKASLEREAERLAPDVGDFHFVK